MKIIRLLFSVLCLTMAFTAVYAQDSGEKDLRWAKSLMEKGDYAYAIEKFEDIARFSLNSEKVRKEAMYYVGYCHVKNNDPWQAVRVLERFLEKYDDSISQEFIPDALYVLGRVYEETGDQRNAIKVYQRCSRNYPGSSFARKSKDRLKELGGSGGNTDPFDDDYAGGGNSGNNDDDNNNDSGHHHGGNPTGISREIRQLLKIAETISNSFTRDQMLLEGSDRARTGEDFVALAKGIENDFTRSQIFDKVRVNQNYLNFTAASMVELAGFISNSYLRDQFLVNLAADFAKRDYVSNYDFVDFSAAMSNDAMRQQLFDAVTGSQAFKLMSARTVVDLANTCKNSYIHDQLLLTAAQKNKYLRHELMILADASSNSFTKSQIIAQASNGVYSSTAIRTRAASDDHTDPFNGFNFNKAQLKRVAQFIAAVDTGKNARESAQQLKKGDSSSRTVREYLEKLRKMQQFDNLHHNR